MPAAAVELEDPAGDVVEEVAVVRDGDDGAGVVREEALEPRDRLGVEVVRRLVEQQQVGRGEQQPAERDAPPLAAGERRRRRGRRRAGAARPSRGRAARRGSRRRGGRSAPAPSPCSASSASKSASGSANAAEISLKRSSRSRSGADAVLDVAAHVLGRVELGLLLRAGRRSRPAASSPRPRGLLDAGHDPQQRRLAGAVRPEHADLRAGQERERDVRRAPCARARRTSRPGPS